MTFFAGGHVLEVSPLSLQTQRSLGQLGGPPILVSAQLFLHHSVVPPAGPCGDSHVEASPPGKMALSLCPGTIASGGTSLSPTGVEGSRGAAGFWETGACGTVVGSHATAPYSGAW